MTGMTSGEGRSRRQGGMGADDDSDSGLALLMGFFALGAVVQTVAWLWGHPLAPPRHSAVPPRYSSPCVRHFDIPPSVHQCADSCNRFGPWSALASPRDSRLPAPGSRRPSLGRVLPIS